MKMWISRHYWWAVPIIIGFSFFILLEAYKYITAPFFYHLQGFSIFILGLLLLISIPFFVGALLMSLAILGRGKSLPRFLLFALLGPLVCFATLLTSDYFLASERKPLPPNFDKIKFDQMLWSANDEYLTGFIRNRQAMAKDLIDNHLPGSSCESIITLLGAPGNLEDKKPKQICVNESVELDYGLGPSQEIMSFLDWDILRIHFSQNGVFERAFVYSTD